MFHWEKLSPDEFKTFQEIISDSNRNLLDVVDEYSSINKDKKDELQCLDYHDFKSFMAIYLGSTGLPDELCRRLFISFLKRPCKPTSKSHALLSKSGSNSLVATELLKKVFPVSSLSEPTEIKSMLNFISKDKNLLSCNAGSFSGSVGGSSSSGVGSATNFSSQSANAVTCSGYCSGGSSSGGGGCISGGGNSSSGGRRGTDLKTGRIQLKDLVCCLSLLEAGRPEDKLEFMFRLYDTDGNGLLDSEEIECIITHMMTVAKYSGWDVSELKPNLEEMMREVDLNGDGCVTLEEWMKAGSNNIPLIVLLGVDSVVTDEGCHVWELKHFNRPAYCNHCLSLLVGLGKQGLRCIYCRYVVHERCVKECKQACIQTYNKGRSLQPMSHHWVEGNNVGKCDMCSKYIKAYNKLTGRRCRWCMLCVHNKCSQQVPEVCCLGRHKEHILSPMQISPTLLHHHKKGRPKELINTKSPSLLRLSSSPSSAPIVLTSSPSTEIVLSSSLPTDTTLTDDLMLQHQQQPPTELSTHEISTFTITDTNNDDATSSNTTSTSTTTSTTTTTKVEINAPTTSTQTADITTATTTAGMTTATTTNNSNNSIHTSLNSIDDINQFNTHSYNAFQLVPLDHVTPLLVFINPKSGGKQGRGLLKKFKRLLNPRQVFNVAADNGFMNGLNFFKDLPSYRILVCGGDGTIGWLLESMDKMNYKENKRPSVAILPLGTGNDLARSFRWGGGYEGEDLHKMLDKVARSSVVMLDRWQVDVRNSPIIPRFPTLAKGAKNTDLTNSDLALTYFSKTSSQKKLGKNVDEDDIHNSSPSMLCLADSLPTTTTTATTTSTTSATALTVPNTTMATTKPPCNIFNNYFSIGVDASIAHKFHVMREKHPERFNSRMKNKLWYLEYGTSETLRATCKNLHESINISCDNTPLDMVHGRSMEGVAILNIGSIYGGSNLWGDPVKVKKRKKVNDYDKELSSGSATSVDLSITMQDMGDGLVEMVGLMNTMHMVKVKGGIHSGTRLAQAANITIQTTKEFPMQIDGEPWIQPPCFLTIRHHNQVPMLMAPTSNRKSLFHNWFSSKLHATHS